jgi:hypothetical protein
MSNFWSPGMRSLRQRVPCSRRSSRHLPRYRKMAVFRPRGGRRRPPLADPAGSSPYPPCAPDHPPPHHTSLIPLTTTFLLPCRHGAGSSAAPTSSSRGWSPRRALLRAASPLNLSIANMISYVWSDRLPVIQ